MGDNKYAHQALAGLVTSLIERDMAFSECKWSATHVAQRSRAEGLSFLTKALPSLGKALDKALATGELFKCPLGFTTERDSALPRFLGPLWNRVFNVNGALLSPEPIAVKQIRQIAYMFYKLELPYTDNETTRVINQFCDVERELADEGASLSPNDHILSIARRLIGTVCSTIDPKDIIPRHGPGSVATGECIRRKSKFTRIYSALEQEYPFTEYFRFSMSHVCDTLDQLEQLEVPSSPTAKVVLVPKDSRGPRIISMEPLEVAWIQQGLRKVLYDRIETCSLTRGHVNFTDQEINRRLALAGSVDSAIATIDMKDASDRVSLRLVEFLFEGTQLLPALRATRSSHTKLPNGRVLEMHKFAPMGSALCFPVEALVFWALSVAALMYECGYSRREALEAIFVYGDDIILPTHVVECVTETLERYNLLVNKDKCCVARSFPFRESCGMDAFLGVNVTPVRIRSVISVNHLHSWVPGYVARSNALYNAGYRCTADSIMKMVHEVMPGIPVVTYCSSPYLDRYTGTSASVVDKGRIEFVRPYASDALYPKVVRFNPDFQRMEYQAYCLSAQQTTPMYDGYERLLRHWAQYVESAEGLEETPAYIERHSAVMRKTWHPVEG